MEQFGKHLIFDGFGVNRDKLSSFDYVFNFLNKLPIKIKMKKLTTPYVVIANSKQKINWGISGFIMIQTSHISCHTWPEKNYLSIDVYSCKDFNEKKILDILKNYWQPKKIKWKVLSRNYCI